MFFLRRFLRRTPWITCALRFHHAVEHFLEQNRRFPGLNTLARVFLWHSEQVTSYNLGINADLRINGTFLLPFLVVNITPLILPSTNHLVTVAVCTPMIFPAWYGLTYFFPLYKTFPLGNFFILLEKAEFRPDCSGFFLSLLKTLIIRKLNIFAELLRRFDSSRMCLNVSGYGHAQF